MVVRYAGIFYDAWLLGLRCVPGPKKINGSLHCKSPGMARSPKTNRARGAWRIISG